MSFLPSAPGLDAPTPRRSKVALSPAIYWLTGLSGAGKSSIAEATVKHFAEHGISVAHLDGDLLRSGLCADLGFTEEDRLENVRRTAEVAKILTSQGIPTICSLISPLRRHRDLARKIGESKFHEIFIQCDLEECVRRDPKGLYARALEGKIPLFTGISAPYEPPTSPELTLNTQAADVAHCVAQLAQFMGRNDPL